MADEQEDSGYYAKRERLGPRDPPKPDKAKFDKSVANHQASIERLQAKMEVIQGRMNELKGKGGGKASGPVAEAKNKMRELRQKKDAVINARKALFDKRDAIKSAMDAMKAQAATMKSGLKFNNVDDITKQLKLLEYNQHTTTMSLTAEKEAIKEIETLKSMKSKLAALGDTKSKMDGAGDQRKEIQAAIAEENKKLSDIAEEIDAQKSILDKLNEKAGEQKDIFPALIREKERLSKEVDALFDLIRTMRLKWREDNNTWFEASKIARVEREKAYEEERKRREAEWEAKQEELEAEEAKKEPYEEEKQLCVYLLKYLEQYSSDAPKAASTGGAAVTEVAHLEGFTPVGKKYTELTEFQSSSASKKTGSGKQNKGISKKKLVHSADTVNTFGMIGILPPGTVGAVAGVIEAVQAKAEWYKTAPRPEKKKKEPKSEGGATAAKSGGKKNQKVPDAAAFPTLGSSAPAEGAAASAPAAQAAAAPPSAPAAPAAAKSDEMTGMEQMAAGAAKDIPPEKKTWGDHRGLNMAMPDISGLEPLVGEPINMNGLGKPLAVLVWGKYAKGDYRTICDFSALAQKYADTIDFLGIGCDPEKENSEALIGKQGKAMAEQNIVEFTMKGLTLAWDGGKKVCNELLKIVSKSTVGPGDMFIFNPAGKCLWLENASGSWSIAQGQFADQLLRLSLNQTLINNGPRPFLPGDEDIEEECDMGEGAGEYVDAFADGGTGDY